MSGIDLDRFDRASVESCEKSDDKESALRLLAHMKDISEDEWRAAWLDGIEITIWYRVINNDDPVARELAVKCGGWWVWVDDDQPTEPTKSGERFVSLQEWVKTSGVPAGNMLP